jgi:type IV pilus assembly protein PilC
MKKKKQQMLGNLEIAAFCDQLSMIVSAGIPIYEGISILQEDAPEEDTAEILSVISNSLDHGNSFCNALKETNVFPKYVLDMIEIGELSGKLEEVLNALTEYYKREESIQNSYVSAAHDCHDACRHFGVNCQSTSCFSSDLYRIGK